MPFSGPDDPKLPDRIKEMSATKRRAFVGAFNSSIEDDPDDEGKAFRIANAAANRAGEKAMPDEIDGQKHDGPLMVMEMPPPLGGATSFEEMDRISEQDRRTIGLSLTFDQFRALIGNVLASEDLTSGQKIERMRGLIDELASRIDMVARDPDVAFKEERGTDGWEPWSADQGTFRAFRDERGDWRWIAIHTNRYEDNAGEIFSDKAHKSFVQWVEETGQSPPLRFWHVPVDLGPSDFLDYSDGFMVSSGTFHDDRQAEALSRMKDLGCSHGFHFRASDLRDGVYHAYRSFEISVLPLDRAANRLTAFIAGEAIPVISEEKRALATSIFGEQGVKDIDAATANLGAAAAAAGLRYKDLTALTMPEGKKEDGMSDEQGTAPAAPTTPPAEAATAPDSPAATPATPDAAAAPADAAPAPADPTQAAESDGSPDASTPAAAAAPPDATSAKALEPLLAGMKGIVDEAVAPLRAALEEQGREIAALKASDDEKIAAAVQPRRGPQYVPASAARSEATVVPEGDVPEGVKAAAKEAAAVGAGQEGSSPPKGIDAYLQSIRMGMNGGMQMMDAE